ncbi:MAG: hypothetical protein JJU31_13655 [Wenzhouxiangella sp.]|nr:hypothetical protein [Wenzhouxiangella sp.]MCH8479486.1 hypothetical protein [Wenzhouxiangella sp.]TVR99145.1 MAG: hypothetical protein EA418_00495 [Wenzhouxiangellaceae bacterium]
MAADLTLSALNVGPKDLMVMRSLLNLAGGRDGSESWQILEQLGGDVAIVDVDSEDGEARLEELNQLSPLVIALTRRKDFSGRFVLHKPLRSREFLNLLTRLASGDIGSAPEAEAEPEKAEPVDLQSDWPAMDEFQNGNYTLAEHLRRQTWKKPVVITHPGWPLVLIDPGSGAWFFDGSITDLSPPMFALSMPATAGVQVSSAELVDRVQGHRQRPLSELKWFSGLAQARGRLHPDLVGEVQFMLTQVPAEAMKNEQLHRLAQILIRGPIGIDELRDESGQAPETIMAFLNASYTSGKLLVNRVARVVSF